MSEWRQALDALAAWVAPEGPGRALVVVAHPDDETLALAGTTRALVAAGWSVDLLCLTAGEAAYPALDECARERLAARRRTELDRAWAHLGGRHHSVLDLPDSGLAARTCEVERLVLAAVADADLLVSLWPGEPHPDHAVVGAATVRAAQEASIGCVTAPLWARVWSGPRQVGLDGAWRSVAVDADTRIRRVRALASHASQVFGFEGQPALLADPVLAALEGPDLLRVEQPALSRAAAPLVALPDPA